MTLSRYVKRKAPPPFITPVSRNSYRKLSGSGRGKVLVGMGLFSNIQKGFKKLHSSGWLDKAGKEVWKAIQKTPQYKKAKDKLSGMGKTEVRLIGTGKTGQGRGILIGSGLFSKIGRAFRKAGRAIKNKATQLAKKGFNWAKNKAWQRLKQIRTPSDLIEAVDELKNLPMDKLKSLAKTSLKQLERQAVDKAIAEVKKRT